MVAERNNNNNANIPINNGNNGNNNNGMINDIFMLNYANFGGADFKIISVKSSLVDTDRGIQNGTFILKSDVIEALNDTFHDYGLVFMDMEFEGFAVQEPINAGQEAIVTAKPRYILEQDAYEFVIRGPLHPPFFGISTVIEGVTKTFRDYLNAQGVNHNYVVNNNNGNGNNHNNNNGNGNGNNHIGGRRMKRRKTYRRKSSHRHRRRRATRHGKK